MKKKIAFTATSFGFGPVSKAVYIAKEIRNTLGNGVQLSFLGSGIALDYAKKNKAFDRLTAFDADSEPIEAAIELSKADLAINVMNFGILSHWRTTIPMFLIDSLAWMWRAPHPSLDRVMTYYIQNYLIDSQTMEMFKPHVEVKIIPPISNRSDNPPEVQNKLLVNFSGAANPFIGDEIYLNYADILAHFITAKAKERFDRIVFAGSKKITDHIRAVSGNRIKIEASHFDHIEFLEHLNSAKKVLTSPGITATLEAINYRSNISFVLPQNFSQALISERYYHQIGFKASMPFSLFGENFTVNSDLPEDVGVSKVLKSLTRILSEKLAEIEYLIGNLMARDPDVPFFELASGGGCSETSGQSIIAADTVQILYA